MNKKILMIIALPLMGVSALAQDITTPSSTINCGEVVFKQPVRAEFEMKNTGSQPLVISEVRTDCGCTTVAYPREPIAAGNSFAVTATYDAKVMGHFHKRLAIYSNSSAGPETLTLTLKGIVVEKKSDYDGAYAFTLGTLRSDANDIEFDNVNRGDMPIQKIHLKNESDEVVEPQLMHLPEYLRAEVSPTRIAPGHSGEVSIQLDSHKLPNLGLTQTSIYLGMFPGDKVSADKEISTSIILMPDFEKLTDTQRANAPKLRLSKGSIEIGSFDGKEKKRDELTITNEGKSTLTIRSLQMLTAGLELSLSKQNIEPGQSAKLKVTAIASLLKKARTKPRILIITNDPEQAKVMINVGL